MANRLTLTFNAPSVLNTEVTFFITQFGVNFERGEIFKANRLNNGETKIGTTDNEQAQFFYEAWNQDYANFALTIEGNVVTLAHTLGLDIFNVSVPANITYEIENTGITVSGLDSDRYLINNPIFVEIGSGSKLDFFSLTIKNLFNQNQVENIRVYPDPNGRVLVNLSAFIKGLFAYPSDAPLSDISANPVTSNANHFEITIYSPNNPDVPAVTITKTFIRGGKRTTDGNQTLPNNSYSRPQRRLPIWTGFPATSYKLVGTQIVRQSLAELPEADKDYRRTKGCNSKYLRFKNLNGGYSEWLFESHEQNNSGSPIGGFERETNVDDLGATFDSNLKLFGKVPQEYIELINDLIISEEVYLYVGRDFKRCTVGKNSIVLDNVKTGYFVTVNIEPMYRLNNSLLWSNY